MRYSVGLPNGGVCGDARTLAEFAELAEEAGWDGVFLEDYIVFQNENGTLTYDPWIALAAMAMRTEHIRLGTAVTALARRRPWKLAREAVTLDHLSNGRLILGVGLGVGNDIDIKAFGEAADDRQRAEMLDEALDILVGLWSGQPFSYQGKHYQLSEVTFLPKPVQIPRIPIWVGGGWPKKGPVRRAARWDGACLYVHTDDWSWRDWTPANLQAFKAYIESHRTTSTPFDIAVGGRRRRDPEQDRALIRSLAEAGATWYGEYVPLAGLDEMRACVARGPLRID